MYKIIATQDFMDLLEELPIRCLSILTNSFVRIEKCEDEIPNPEDSGFLDDLLAQIRNGELE